MLYYKKLVKYTLAVKRNFRQKILICLFKNNFVFFHQTDLFLGYLLNIFITLHVFLHVFNIFCTFILIFYLLSKFILFLSIC